MLSHLCARERITPMTSRWTSYGIPWDLVDGYGWAETYRCVGMPERWLHSVLQSLLNCLLLATVYFLSLSVHAIMMMKASLFLYAAGI